MATEAKKSGEKSTNGMGSGNGVGAQGRGRVVTTAKKLWERSGLKPRILMTMFKYALLHRDYAAGSIEANHFC